MCLNKCLFVDKLGHLWVRKLWLSWNRLLAIPKAILKTFSVNGWLGTIPMGWSISPTSTIGHIESPIGFKMIPGGNPKPFYKLCKAYWVSHRVRTKSKRPGQKQFWSGFYLQWKHRQSKKGLFYRLTLYFVKKEITFWVISLFFYIYTQTFQPQIETSK